MNDVIVKTIRLFNVIQFKNFFSSSLCVPDGICFASVYHTNIDRLATTPTRSMLCHAIVSQSELAQKVILLRKYKLKLFSQDKTIYIAQHRIQTKGQKPCCSQLARLSTELHRRYRCDISRCYFLSL